jgi:hypothetical protein
MVSAEKSSMKSCVADAGWERKNTAVRVNNKHAFPIRRRRILVGMVVSPLDAPEPGRPGPVRLDRLGAF